MNTGMKDWRKRTQYAKKRSTGTIRKSLEGKQKQPYGNFWRSNDVEGVDEEDFKPNKIIKTILSVKNDWQ